jgi:hypothetical protein
MYVRQLLTWLVRLPPTNYGAHPFSSGGKVKRILGVVQCDGIKGKRRCLYLLYSHAAEFPVRFVFLSLCELDSLLLMTMCAIVNKRLW